jgi:hypothetical protein
MLSETADGVGRAADVERRVADGRPQQVARVECWYWPVHYLGAAGVMVMTAVVFCLKIGCPRLERPK